MAITTYGVEAQNLWKAPVLPEEQIEIIDTPAPLIQIDTVPVLYNQFRDYVEFQQQHQRPEHHPMPFGYLPRPKEVIKRGDRVVVVYDRKDWERFMIARQVHFKRMMERRKAMPWR